MQKFRTTFSLPAYPFQLSHDDNILSIGSCFADNIGGKLFENKFHVLRNPFGVIYNPASVAQSLKYLLQERRLVNETDLVQNGELWYSRQHHSSFADMDKARLLDNLNTKMQAASTFFKDINTLLITWGTAFVWQEKETTAIVANCHKRPQKLFNRKKLSVEDIIEKSLPVLNKAKENNPSLRVLLTVSPIRHTNDGFIENQRSKASLIIAAEQLEKTLDFVSYFPAYELLQDDLRDYRFYEKDMLHPNELAVDYIWEKFSAAFFSEQTETLLKRIAKIRKAALHRPFKPESSAHQTFIQKNLHEIKELKKMGLALDFSEEIALFQKAQTKLFS